MTGGSSAAPTIDKPVALDKVQTGGFGDAQGLPGPGNPNKRANIGQFGNPALPPGPGYGNGTGGANGVKGTVASTGFGNVWRSPKRVARRSPAGCNPPALPIRMIKSLTCQKRRSKRDRGRIGRDFGQTETGVFARSPQAEYRRRSVARCHLPASGNQVHVNRVVKGLGHGLDEAAMRAAEQIKFKPALSNGHPVDFPAVVHIVFQNGLLTSIRVRARPLEKVRRRYAHSEDGICDSRAKCPAPNRAAQQNSAVDQVVDRIISQEQAEMNSLRPFSRWWKHIFRILKATRTWAPFPPVTSILWAVRFSPRVLISNR